MIRTNFYYIERNDDIDEYDYLHNNLTKFKMNYKSSYYRIEQDDLMRPDLISYKIYGTIAYWWLIMMINGIQNPLKDMELGALLQIPNILDIYEFQKKWTVR